MKVPLQGTGIRRDAFANNRRIPTEQVIANMTHSSITIDSVGQFSVPNVMNQVFAAPAIVK